MKDQKTLVIIKPDAVKRGIVGEILSRYENKGLRISRMNMLTATDTRLEAHYSAHIGKPFYNDLLTFMKSGPMIILIVEGLEAVDVVRKINGATHYLEADCGSIRGLYALSETENCVHASDSEESALSEIGTWF